MTLSDAKWRQGQTIEIVGFSTDSIFRERLQELGLHVGTQITILGRAPFGGPLLIRFNNSFLALRNEEAACAQVKSA